MRKRQLILLVTMALASTGSVVFPDETESPTPTQEALHRTVLVSQATDFAQQFRDDSLAGYFAVVVSPAEKEGLSSDGDIGPFLQLENRPSAEWAVIVIPSHPNDGDTYCVYFVDTKPTAFARIESGTSGGIDGATVTTALTPLDIEFVPEGPEELYFSDVELTSDNGTPVRAVQVQSGGTERVHSKPSFGYEAHVPSNWTVYREYEDQTEAVVSFGLPKVWSELEQQEIENAVSVAAYRREDIASLEDVLSFESGRIRNILVSSTEVPSNRGRTFVRIAKIRGVAYKSLVSLRFENNVGYVVTFTATDGTYAKNLPLFEAFLAGLTFSLPAPIAPQVFESRVETALALYERGPSKAKEVTTVLEEELEENPENLKAITLIGITHFGVGEYSEALTWFEKGIDVAGKLKTIRPRLVFYQARALHELDRNEEALEVLRAYWAFFQEDGKSKREYEILISMIEKEMDQN